MKKITNIVEPERLFLVWQAPKGGSRKRRIVGELIRTPDGASLHYFIGSHGFEEARRRGFEGYPAYTVTREHHTKSVLQTFLRRLPPRTRSDFPTYLEKLRLPKDAQLSDFALLGYSEAKLPGDGFSILLPFSDVTPPFEFMSEVAGFRYWAKLEDINIGDEAGFEREPENEYDPSAVKVIVDEMMIGYVNRVHAPRFAEWLDKFNVTASVERINGTDERPLVYLFVSVRE